MFHSFLGSGHPWTMQPPRLRLSLPFATVSVPWAMTEAINGAMLPAAIEPSPKKNLEFFGNPQINHLTKKRKLVLTCF